MGVRGLVMSGWVWSSHGGVCGLVMDVCGLVIGGELLKVQSILGYILCFIKRGVTNYYTLFYPEGYG